MNSLITGLWMSHAKQACSAFNKTMHLIPCLDSIPMALAHNSTSKEDDSSGCAKTLSPQHRWAAPSFKKHG